MGNNNNNNNNPYNYHQRGGADGDEEYKQQQQEQEEANAAQGALLLQQLNARNLRDSSSFFSGILGAPTSRASMLGDNPYASLLGSYSRNGLSSSAAGGLSLSARLQQQGLIGGAGQHHPPGSSLFGTTRTSFPPSFLQPQQQGLHDLQYNNLPSNNHQHNAVLRQLGLAELPLTTAAPGSSNEELLLRIRLLEQENRGLSAAASLSSNNSATNTSSNQEYLRLLTQQQQSESSQQLVAAAARQYDLQQLQAQHQHQLGLLSAARNNDHQARLLEELLRNSNNSSGIGSSAAQLVQGAGGAAAYPAISDGSSRSAGHPSQAAAAAQFPRDTVDPFRSSSSALDVSSSVQRSDAMDWVAVADASPLLEPEYHRLVSDLSFACMAQMKPCVLSHEDRVGMYKTRGIGFPGLVSDDGGSDTKYLDSIFVLTFLYIKSFPSTFSAAAAVAVYRVSVAIFPAR